MAWLMVRVGAEEQAHEIDEDVLFIGADDDAGIRLVGTGIAAKHCQVLRTEAGYRLVDLGSQHGTLVNGSKVADAMLNDGDVMVVGSQTMVFRTRAAAPAAPPAPAPAAPAPAAPTPGSTSRAGRSRGARRTGSRSASARSQQSEATAPTRGAASGRGSGARASRAAGAARSGRAEGDQPLVRRKLRESNGMSDSVMYTLIGGSVLGISAILYFFLSQPTDGVNERLIQVQDAVSQGENARAAMLITELYKDTPEDHDQYKFIKKRYDELSGIQERLEKVSRNSAEITQFANNIAPFYKKYLDDPKEAQYKDDTTVMRYFVEYRCEPYLERFAGHNYANYPTVKRWAAELGAKYDRSKAFPSKWWDYELISAMEEKREHYGVSYRILNSYLKDGDGRFREECEGKIEMCLHRARILWQKFYYEQRILPVITSSSKRPEYGSALSYLNLAWRVLKDIPEFRDPICKAAEELRKRAEKDGKTIDTSKFI